MLENPKGRPLYCHCGCGEITAYVKNEKTPQGFLFGYKVGHEPTAPIVTAKTLEGERRNRLLLSALAEEVKRRMP